VARPDPAKDAEIARRLVAGERVMQIVDAVGTSEVLVGKVRLRLMQAGYKSTGGKLPESKPQTLDDQLSTRRLEAEVADLRRGQKRLLDELNDARDIRDKVLDLTSEPMSIRTIKAPRMRDKRAETAVLCISDVHMGEVVDLDQMDGVNSYNESIARARLDRLFSKTGELLTEHYKGPRLNRLVIWAGGDLVTGEIHEELAKTNDMQNFPAVKAVAECIVSGIAHLRSKLPDVPIEVYSTPGNHGRMSRKPEPKRYFVDSLDTLAADFIELGLKTAGIPDIPVVRPASGEMLLNIDGRNVLFTHGDRIGSRGGQGFVGAAATVARGFKKIVGEYADRGIIIHWIVIGHFHVKLMLEEGYVNPSVIGPTEYSRDGRMKPHPAGQRLFLMHPHHGITLDRVVNLGSPEEGSIYSDRS